MGGHDESFILTGNQTLDARLIALKHGLRLEILGLRHSRRELSAYKILKEQYGYQGTRKEVLAQVSKDVDILISPEHKEQEE